MAPGQPAVPAQGTPQGKHLGPPKNALFYDPRLRSVVVQVLLCAVILFFGWVIFDNVTDNLARNKITSGFGFLSSAPRRLYPCVHHNAKKAEFCHA